MIFLYLLIALLSVLAYLIRKNINYWHERGIPCEPPNWITGNMQGFAKTRALSDIYEDVYRKFKGTGPFCGFYFFQKPVALVLDTQLAKNVLIKDFGNFVNRNIFYNEIDDPLTGHLFALDGLKWKQMRHRLSPTFTSGKMKFMFPTVIKVAEQFIQTIELQLEHANEMEFSELCARFTTDVIGTCAFGIECNSLKDPHAEFRAMGRNANQRFRHGKLVFGLMQSFPDLSRKLHLRQTPEDVHQFFMGAVRETIAYREEHNIKRNDFMDLLIELKNMKTTETAEGEVLRALTVEEIAAQCFLFFLAGFETSSVTMSFTLYELACHTEVQEQLRAEINAALAKHNQIFTYECMKDLQYMNQVISEISRLYTVVPQLIRQAADDYTVPGHPTYKIEKGISVIIPTSAYHHDAEIYPEPLSFKPERFSAAATAARDSIEWLPFGEGPRNCIGMRFGLMQTRIGLAMLLKNFKFSTCTRTTIPMKFDAKSLVLSAIGGIYLHVEKI